MFFTELKVGQKFTCNGTLFVKKSTRTGVALNYGRVFYFTKNDQVREVE